MRMQYKHNLLMQLCNQMQIVIWEEEVLTCTDNKESHYSSQDVSSFFGEVRFGFLGEYFL